MEQHTGPPDTEIWRPILDAEHAQLCPHAHHRAYMDHNSAILGYMQAAGEKLCLADFAAPAGEGSVRTQARPTRTSGLRRRRSASTSAPGIMIE